MEIANTGVQLPPSPPIDFFPFQKPVKPLQDRKKWWFQTRFRDHILVTHQSTFQEQLTAVLNHYFSIPIKGFVEYY